MRINGLPRGLPPTRKVQDGKQKWNTSEERQELLAKLATFTPHALVNAAGMRTEVVRTNKETLTVYVKGPQGKELPVHVRSVEPL